MRTIEPRKPACRKPAAAASPAAPPPTMTARPAGARLAVEVALDLAQVGLDPAQIADQVKHVAADQNAGGGVGNVEIGQLITSAKSVGNGSGAPSASAAARSWAA